MRACKFFIARSTFAEWKIEEKWVQIEDLNEVTIRSSVSREKQFLKITFV